MFLFILGLLFLAVALGLLIYRLVNRKQVVAANAAAQRQSYQPTPYLGWGAGAAAFLAFLTIFFSVFYSVGTKEEGILISYGATSGHVGSGPHLKWPWERVVTMDAAIQTDTYEDTTSDKVCKGIAVRLAYQQTGCASVSIQWRINPKSGDELYKDYRSFDHVRNALVTRKLILATNEAFVGYNPLNIADGAATPNETLPQIAKDITQIMKREVGVKIEVLSVLLPLVTYDPSTQQRINQLQAQVALTQVAKQKKITNTNEAAANKVLATSVDNSPNVLVARCLDTLEEMVKNGQTVPAGFSCWPGGSGTPVIANSGK